MGERAHVVRIVTVHGTGDTALSVEGEKWFQRGSAFASRLTERLTASGLSVEILPYLWSGANSATARAAAAAGLQRTISHLAEGGKGVHVVGHSHGGNVANDAACRIDWRRSRGPRKIRSIATVGTPFLKLRVGAFESVATLLASIIAAVAIAGCLYALLIERHFLYAPYLLGALFGAPFYAAALTRLARAGRRKRPSLRILAVRHPNDEAIAFLQHVERIDIEAFPRGSLNRASGAGAPLISMLASVAMSPLYIPNAIDAVQSSGEQVSVGVVALQSVIMIAIFAAPYFSITYFIVRLGALLILEGLLRGMLNGEVSGILKGLALGRDGGMKVGDTSPQSHYFGTAEVILQGDLAQRMINASSEATGRLFDKYRSSLFSVGADASNAVIEMARDAMTWDSLIHTTYFDQPELADMIADHIVAAERT